MYASIREIKRFIGNWKENTNPMEMKIIRYLIWIVDFRLLNIISWL